MLLNACVKQSQPSEPLVAVKARQRYLLCFAFTAVNDSEGKGEGQLYTGVQEQAILDWLVLVRCQNLVFSVLTVARNFALFVYHNLGAGI